MFSVELPIKINWNIDLDTSSKKCPNRDVFLNFNKNEERSKKRKRTQWTALLLWLEALGYTTRSEFQSDSKGVYLKALRWGILDDICSHMKMVLTDWTDETLQLEALKYKTRTDSKIGSGAAYAMALKRGILDLICSHMETIYKNWTLEMLRKEALKYKTRTEFYRGNCAAYTFAKRYNLLNSVCPHMSIISNESSPEKELYDAIKETFTEAEQRKKVKANIKDKPYMHSFECDILISSICRGIEFDGTHWHSFKKMRKDPHKKNWTDEDIRNYHEIKDSVFASYGIEILHIKEKDWEEDKYLCIARCLEFLEISNELRRIA